ncbi:MAG: hypothetical protein HZA93_13695 [Verrucomicrobia bacterium]|nr:hypothetical protein [Verrucomicrobiota bacterium]
MKQNSRLTKQLTSERGAALLAAMCFAAALAIALGSYLTLCYRSLQMSTRNMSSTHSVELAEVGMEEALWALNKNDWSSWTITGTTATKTTSGFTYDNGVTGSVTATVTNYDGSLASDRTVTVTGTTTLDDGSTTSRTLTSTSSKAPLFVNAVAATAARTTSTGSVSFSSGGTVDSYDSALGTYASQTPTYSAILASSATAPDSATIALVNAQVKGYAASNYPDLPSFSTSATLRGPSTPLTTKIDTARISTSPYQPLFSILTPSGAGTTVSSPAAGTTLTLGVAGETTPRLYYCNSIDLKAANTKIVVNGPVQLVITGSGSFYVGLNGGNNTTLVQISSTGSLEVFTGGDIAIYKGGISNLTLDPKKCAIYGTWTGTAPDMNTATAFHGVVYLPYADFKVISNNAIYGSIVANKVVFSGGSPVVHYDVNLRDVSATDFRGLEQPYAVSNWRETTNP